MTKPDNTITVEARSVGDAVALAARQLDVDISLVSFDLDLSHFRTEDGRRQSQDTVKVIAWTRDASETKGAVAARDWLATLIEKMGIKAEVSVRVTDAKTAELRVDTPQARHLVGRRGITLHSINDLLAAAMSKSHGDWSFRLNVEGGEDQNRDRDDRGSRGSRSDRGDRGDRRDRRDRDDRPARGGHRDRDDRSSRGGRRERDQGNGEGRSERDLDRLRSLSRRLAQEAIDTGEPVEIRRQLNSFERRVVHLVISEIDGVATESVGEGPHKSVVIKATGDGASSDS